MNISFGDFVLFWAMLAAMPFAAIFVFRGDWGEFLRFCGMISFTLALVFSLAMALITAHLKRCKR